MLSFYKSQPLSFQGSSYIAHEPSLQCDRFDDTFFVSLDIARIGYVTAFLHAATIGSMPSVMNTSLSRGSSPPDKVRLLVRFIFFTRILVGVAYRILLPFYSDC